MEVNFKKLKVTASNLVIFEIVRVKFGINRCQNLKNSTRKS
jgi:hypothetical protein